MIKKNKIISMGFALLIVLLGGGFLVVSPILKLLVTNKLSAEYNDVKVSEVSANLITGHIVLKGIEASNPDSGGFEVSKAVIIIDPISIFSKQIHVGLITFSGISITAIELQDDSWAIAGLNGKEISKRPEQQKDMLSEWSWSIDKIKLNNLQLSLIDKNENENKIIIYAESGRVANDENELMTPFNLKASLLKGSVEIDGKVLMLSEFPVVVGNIRIMDLNLDILADYLKVAGLENIKALLSADLKVKFAPDTVNGLPRINTDGRISLAQIAAKYSSTASGIDISNGSVIFNGTSSYVLGDDLEAIGVLKAEDFVAKLKTEKAQI